MRGCGKSYQCSKSVSLCDFRMYVKCCLIEVQLWFRQIKEGLYLIRTEI